MTATNLQRTAPGHAAMAAQPIGESKRSFGPSIECLAFLLALMGVAGVTSLALAGII